MVDSIYLKKIQSYVRSEIDEKSLYKIHKYYGKIMNGAGKKKRDCDNYDNITQKWNDIENAWKYIETYENLQFKGKIMKSEDGKYVTVEEPKTFDQYL